MFIIILFTYILSVISDIETLISSTIRDNKLIAIYKIERTSYIKARVFELKEGAIADVFNTRKLYDFGFIDRYFVLNFMDIPDDIIKDKNRLLLKFMHLGLSYGYTASSFMNWVGYLNLSDMSLENALDFIKFPTHENFPVSGYTVNSIANEFGAALYVTGGELYSEKDHSYTVSNSFYKYNFTSKEWEDMTYSVKGNLKPLVDHKSVVVDNRYLVILGGRRPATYSYKFNFNDFNTPGFEFNSLYNLTIFDSFTNSWESVNIKADIFDADIATFQFIEFLATVYKDKIIVFGGMAGENKSTSFGSYGNLGILDFKSKNWNWPHILNEDGSSYKRGRAERNIQVLNDQLIICTDFFEEENRIPILIYDIPSKRMKSTLQLSNDADSIKEKNITINLPTYAIILISVSCTALLVVFIYLIYRKYKNISGIKSSNIESNEPIHEVWANPDIDITSNIITFDKMDCSNMLCSNRLYKNSKKLNISNTTEFNK